MAYVVFTNVHGDTEARDLDFDGEKTLVLANVDCPDAEDPLLPYFDMVEEALAVRQDAGATGDLYWQSFRVYFD